MLRYSTLSRKGDRPHNEDCVKVISTNKLCGFIVCDGLGGHEHGDIAAQTACAAFVSELENCNCVNKSLENAFQKAQDDIMCIQQNHSLIGKMKTTAVCMVADGKYAHVGHIGDSRCYTFNKGDEICRTLDHSVPQMLVLSHTIKESEIRNHPNRNMLLKVMGEKWDEPMFELQKPFPLNECKAFLLCTDGFWELIEEDEMLKTLNESSSPSEWLNKMTDIVLERGKAKKMDNYSAIAIMNS